jgi:hypothetical protein
VPNEERIKGGEAHVVDDLCDSFNTLAAGYGQQLHHRRVHSHTPGDCVSSIDNQHNSGPQAGRLEPPHTVFALRDARSLTLTSSEGTGVFTSSIRDRL